MKGSLKEQGFITLLSFHVINLCETDKPQKNEGETEKEQREAKFLGLGSVYKNNKEPLPRPSPISEWVRVLLLRFLRNTELRNTRTTLDSNNSPPFGFQMMELRP